MNRAQSHVPAYASKRIDSPVGPLQLVANSSALVAILWKHEKPGRVPLGKLLPDASHPILLETQRQLEEYFAGRRQAFTVELYAAGGTDFQQRVWNALLTIPYGETRSYAQLAAQIGHPRAVRAVGAANGRNPLSIIVPCHRVVGSTGKLTGFAGGLEAKAYLLALEGSGRLLVADGDQNTTAHSLRERSTLLSGPPPAT
jgi:methylated-DNA-[protein]-cysteine S-methyltransferase